MSSVASFVAECLALFPRFLLVPFFGLVSGFSKASAQMAESVDLSKEQASTEKEWICAFACIMTIISKKKEK
jgi:hypothetical protein